MIRIWSVGNMCSKSNEILLEKRLISLLVVKLSSYSAKEPLHQILRKTPQGFLIMQAGS